ncbi:MULTISPECIES: hypothetical protein [unclassified Knoellia]|uniref:hypothetical protein n=1 Tax=Knoellia altitudinis TaxID=3404795 RepID=UPI00360D295F
MAVTYFFDDGPFTYLSPVSEMSGLPVATQVTADDYLAYAKSDLAGDGNQGPINALGNAKRSLHLMIDTLLQNYGMLAQNTKLRFPEKLGLLDDVGLISFNVFRKLNLERNLAEHEYTVPSRGQVEDFVDVCHLLRLAIERLGESVLFRAAAGLRQSQEHVLLALEPAQGLLNIYELRNPRFDKSRVFGEPVDYVSTRLDQGERYPNATVSAAPVRGLALAHSNRAEWAPLLTTLISSQQSGDRQATVVHDGVATVWVARHFATNEMAGTEIVRLLGLEKGSMGTGGVVQNEDAPTDLRPHERT